MDGPSRASTPSSRNSRKRVRSGSTDSEFDDANHDPYVQELRKLVAELDSMLRESEEFFHEYQEKIRKFRQRAWELELDYLEKRLQESARKFAPERPQGISGSHKKSKQAFGKRFKAVSSKKANAVENTPSRSGLPTPSRTVVRQTSKTVPRLNLKSPTTLLPQTKEASPSSPLATRSNEQAYNSFDSTSTLANEPAPEIKASDDDSSDESLFRNDGAIYRENVSQASYSTFSRDPGAKSSTTLPRESQQPHQRPTSSSRANSLQPKSVSEPGPFQRSSPEPPPRTERRSSRRLREGERVNYAIPPVVDEDESQTASQEADAAAEKQRQAMYLQGQGENNGDDDYTESQPKEDIGIQSSSSSSSESEKYSKDEKPMKRSPGRARKTQRASSSGADSRSSIKRCSNGRRKGNGKRHGSAGAASPLKQDSAAILAQVKAGFSGSPTFGKRQKKLDEWASKKDLGGEGPSK